MHTRDLRVGEARNFACHKGAGEDPDLVEGANEWQSIVRIRECADEKRWRAPRRQSRHRLGAGQDSVDVEGDGLAEGDDYSDMVPLTVIDDGDVMDVAVPGKEIVAAYPEVHHSAGEHLEHVAVLGAGEIVLTDEVLYLSGVGGLDPGGEGEVVSEADGGAVLDIHIAASSGEAESLVDSAGAEGGVDHAAGEVVSGPVGREAVGDAIEGPTSGGAQEIAGGEGQGLHRHGGVRGVADYHLEAKGGIRRIQGEVEGDGRGIGGNEIGRASCR